MTRVLEYMPIDDAGGVLAELQGRLSRDDDAIALTMRGKPALAVMRWEAFASIVETDERQSRPSMPVSDETFKLVMSEPGYLDA